MPKSAWACRWYLSFWCLLLGSIMGCRQPAPSESPPPPATVKWQGVSSTVLEEWTELVGTTVPLPDRVAHVSAAVQGQVVEVFGDPEKNPVKEGGPVKKGTPLVRLDTRIIAANVAKAEAALNGLGQEVQQAQYAVELAEAEVERLKTLAAKENTQPSGDRTPLVSAVERLKAEYALKDAKSKLQGARDRVTTATKERAALQTEMGLYTLTAPIKGRVGRIEVVPGQAISIGTTVTDVLDIEDQIDVLCFVPPALVRVLKEGNESKPAVPRPIDEESATVEPKETDHVEYIAELAEPETGNFAVKVRFDNKEAKLGANRVLRIRVRTQEPRECLSVPEKAVNESEETPTVVVVDQIAKKNDKGKEETVYIAHRVNAVLGMRDRLKKQIEIVSLTDPEKDPKKRWQGKLEDAQVIVEGAQGLESGDPVKLEVEGD